MEKQNKSKMEMNRKMEVKGKKEEGDKLFGPGGKNSGMAHTVERGWGGGNRHFRLGKEDILEAPRRAVS